MKKNNITQQILTIHEEETMRKIMNEVKQELEEGISEALQSELDALLIKSKEIGSIKSGNVLQFKEKAKERTPQFILFAETELLAAAGKSLGDWFSQPISFGGGGFLLDVRRVLGSKNEVDIYLKPNKSDTSEMRKTLAPYLGKSVHLMISNDDNVLLDANLYIDKNGHAAEGDGTLIYTGNTKIIKGSININIEIKD